MEREQGISFGKGKDRIQLSMVTLSYSARNHMDVVPQKQVPVLPSAVLQNPLLCLLPSVAPAVSLGKSLLC